MAGGNDDRRVLKSNGKVADISLLGLVEADQFVTPLTHRVARPVTSIYRTTDASQPRERELAFGEVFLVLETRGRFAFGFAARDGYVGYVLGADLTQHDLASTHRVIGQSYWSERPSLKNPDPAVPLPIGALVHVRGTAFDNCDWGLIDVFGPGGAIRQGHVPMPHLLPVEIGNDLVLEAERYLGVPYLWGGNSGFGIDCSGLVQAACLACGIACPGDSDQQFQNLGTPLQDDKELERGDLIFWKGHVAIVVGDGRILHANAHHMAVTYEDQADAVGRIAAKDGPVTGRRRVVGANPG